MASREELLSSISPQMRLDKAFFMRVYGYEITWPGFAEVALRRLEELGCSKAREYYSGLVANYEAQSEADMKEAARWYVGQFQKEKESDELRIRKRMLKILRNRS